MILLLGGTSESISIAAALAISGFQVLVSSATDVELRLPAHSNIHHRSGRLDQEELISLIIRKGIRAVVDVSHPYALVIKQMASEVCSELNIPYFRWIRPSCLEDTQGLLLAKDHDRAADMAFSFNRTVFLTIGSKNVLPYAKRARELDIKLIARVLDHRDSINSCLAAGMDPRCILKGRGPFTTNENLEVLQRYNVGVLVTKDSGSAGGVLQKLEAAKQYNARIIIVLRPEYDEQQCFQTVEDLVIRIKTIHSTNVQP